MNLIGMEGLPLLSDAKTYSISAENPTGEKGGGAQAVPQADSPAARLGPRWKVRPCITLEPRTITQLADIVGPGIVQHIWITVGPEAYRDAVIRFYWDSEQAPSVETPLGDLFCNGHGLRYNVNSLPVAVNPSGGFNCYWPMPFRQRARITIDNQRQEPIPGFFYQISYARTKVPVRAARFHAQWRRSVATQQHPEHVILDGVRGQGHYVGTFLAWTQLSNGWWGEGEVKFYLDGDTDRPTICGTGTEDYFGGAWCFGGGDDPAAAESYSTSFLGYPLCRIKPGEVPRHALYRWHVLDPVRFQRDLKVAIQALGWWPDGTFQPLTDDIASVAYWYQAEPHAPFPDMRPIHERWSR